MARIVTDITAKTLGNCNLGQLVIRQGGQAGHGPAIVLGNKNEDVLLLSLTGGQPLVEFGLSPGTVVLAIQAEVLWNINFLYWVPGEEVDKLEGKPFVFVQDDKHILATSTRTFQLEKVQVDMSTWLTTSISLPRIAFPDWSIWISRPDGPLTRELIYSSAMQG